MFYWLQDKKPVWFSEVCGEIVDDPISPADLRDLVRAGQMHPRHWMVHGPTGKHRLAYEVLGEHRLIPWKEFKGYEALRTEFEAPTPERLDAR